MHKIAPAWKWLLLLLLAVIAIAASFHFDAAVRQWVVDHSNHTIKQMMRNVSRFGDWPEHVLAGLLLIAIAAWRGNKRWVHIGVTMIVACALAGIAARAVKIATGRARPSVKQEARLERPASQFQIQLLPERSHRRDHRLLRRALLRQPSGRARSPADPTSYRRLAHVRRSALPVGRRLCRHPRPLLRLALRALASTTNQQLTISWRRGWDSNPRGLAPCRFSRPEPSTTRPPLQRCFASPGVGWRNAGPH